MYGTWRLFTEIPPNRPATSLNPSSGSRPCRPRIANDKNFEQLLAEFKEYALKVDMDFVRGVVKAIGQVAIKIDNASERCWPSSAYSEPSRSRPRVPGPG